MLLEIEDRIKQYRFESDVLDQQACLNMDPMKSDPYDFGTVTKRVYKDLSSVKTMQCEAQASISMLHESSRKSTQHVDSALFAYNQFKSKDMNTGSEVRRPSMFLTETVSRMEKLLAENLQAMDEIEDLLAAKKDEISHDNLKKLKNLMTHSADYFLMVCAKVGKMHAFMDEMRREFNARIEARQLIINYEEGFAQMKEGIRKCTPILNGDFDAVPSTEEQKFYHVCCSALTSRKDTQECTKLYDLFKFEMEQAIRMLVIPKIMHKNGATFLKELMHDWSNYCLMVKCVVTFFSSLEKCFIDKEKLPTLPDVALSCFFSLVNERYNKEIIDALLTLIRQERDGSIIDTNLLTRTLCALSVSQMSNTVKHVIVKETEEYYARISTQWVLQYSMHDYIAKARAPVNKETKNIATYISVSEAESVEICHQVVSAPLMQTYERYTKERGQLFLQSYLDVEADLADRYSRFTV